MEENDNQPTLKQEDLKSISRNDDFLPAYIWVPNSIWKFIWGILVWVFDFIVDIFKALWNACLVVYRLCTKGVLAIGKSIWSLCHKFRYNDWAGRMNYLVFGVSDFKNRRYVNGAIYLGFEVAYIILFALFGWGCVYELGSLGVIDEAQQVCDASGICQNIAPDNSILVIVYGILWLMSVCLFLFVWRKSIDNGYKNYRIRHFDDFNRRGEVSKPYSDLIDKDMVENALYSKPTKQLRERYADVYKALEAQAGLDSDKRLNKMDRAYYRYVLNSTISYRRSFHKELLRLTTKSKAIQDKIKAVEENEATNQKIDALSKASDAAFADYSQKRAVLAKLADELTAAPEEKKAALEASISEAKKGFKSAEWKKVFAANRLVGAKQRKQGKIDKLEEKLRVVDSKIEDMNKNNLSFSTIDSVENQTKYGKFNAYYRNLASMETELTFYRHYDEFVASYEEGLKSYEQANADNAAAREKLAEKSRGNLRAINEQYDGIDARRQSIIQSGEDEKAACKAKVEEIRGNASLSEAEKHRLIAEAKATMAYNLKTVKGKVLALPTAKEVKASRKEEIKNAVNAYKRDKRGLKVDYTPEEYALYCASNTMIVKYGLEYKFAYEKAKKLIAHNRLDEAAVNAKVGELEEKKAAYIENNPTKFDGHPKTVVEQVRSMLDENFHITLLALPILGVLFFTIMPLVLSILVAFTDYNHSHNLISYGFNWAGLSNWIKLFSNGGASGSLFAGLGDTIIWTFVWAICATFSCYFVGIIFALMINKEGIKFKKVFRFCFMLSIAVPSFVTLMAISILFRNGGAVAELWRDIFGSPLNFAPDAGATVADINRTKAIIILINLWHGVPYTILQTSGILMNIPKDLYESSKIDGANTVVQFTKITMPYIFFVTGPSLIQTFIGNINNFGSIYFLTGGGPTRTEPIYQGMLGHTDLLITYIYKLVTTSAYADYGLASVIGILVFIICAFVSIVMYNRSSAISREDQFQ